MNLEPSFSPKGTRERHYEFNGADGDLFGFTVDHIEQVNPSRGYMSALSRAEIGKGSASLTIEVVHHAGFPRSNLIDAQGADERGLISLPFSSLFFALKVSRPLQAVEIDYLNQSAPGDTAEIISAHRAFLLQGNLVPLITPVSGIHALEITRKDNKTGFYPQPGSGFHGYSAYIPTRAFQGYVVTTIDPALMRRLFHPVYESSRIVGADTICGSTYVRPINIIRPDQLYLLDSQAFWNLLPAFRDGGILYGREKPRQNIPLNIRELTFPVCVLPDLKF
ncbi:hypothetical protein H6802_02170 [Candidatus Nomurabacteria bacterium]|uniref:Uncharacterized protein n=1 Tax=candidate division WWE3 bacterium TaxID=2053526 RepID=A0A955E150_UNCKA|nr:hypothetical protein [candidate division WWE3 bacterium]MCB9823738.1 hypothetical protein [Candidatus Nomurabacteria bacterium]MCB9827183.1 hypothetical protein [Candidatus Nomurabacteria bacterium]MCB9827533.1 hypothetical protein [Candidatus Nomurabacteria bacterium]HXK52796.1 hypothetical protein [bacterium]